MEPFNPSENTYNGPAGPSVSAPQPSHVNVRCPGCLKLFSVFTAEIKEPRPQFQCNQCEEQFYLMFPECLGMGEVVGFPMHLKIHSIDSMPDDATSNPGEAVQDPVLESPLDPLPVDEQKLRSNELINSGVTTDNAIFHCPKCEGPRRGGEKECSHCGVVFDKLKLFEEASRPSHVSNQKLNTAWDQVMEDYSNMQGHDDFVAACQSQQQLDFAAYKYRKILNAYSGDEVANKMIKKIENIALASSGLAQHRRRGHSPFRFRWTTIMVGLGIVLMAMGYGIEQLRNLIGVGVALIFLSLALRVTFRNN